MEASGLLKSLNDHDVRYVVIGATAFPVHGYARTTLDVDIFIDPEPGNVRRTMAALTEFGYDLQDLTIEDLSSQKVLIRQYILETDVHPFVKGVSFDEVWAHRVEAEINGVTAHFADLDDLIKMKEAAGRPKDIADLQVLNELKRNKR
ncbi:MAG: nucleotidyltransferase [Candidatus Edwardsbacteria bacterium]|nr:nucleotidyltransferase [Candidatus Edwardsbacteria bacterium]